MTKSFGFTLIELTVVISILAVLTTGGLAAFVNYSRSQQMQNTALSIKNSLILAKSRAFSQTKPEQCGNQALDGYKVLFSSVSSYEVDVICAGNQFRMKTENFPSGIILSSETTSTSFFFPVLSGTVEGSGKIVLYGYNLKRTIVVDANGTIR